MPMGSSGSKKAYSSVTVLRVIRRTFPLRHAADARGRDGVGQERHAATSVVWS